MVFRFPLDALLMDWKYLVYLVRIAATLMVTVGFVVIGSQLHRGRFSSLVFSPRAPFEGTDDQRSKVELERCRCASWVSFSSAAVLGFLAIFAIFTYLNNPSLSLVFSAASNISLLLLIISIVHFYLRLGIVDDKKVKFRTSNTRANIFIVADILVLIIVALLY